ncbi:AAA family ATPase [Rugosimonospora africana]|uniref:MoxR-like ATPase n=1 Tax=Rugosimonospora africana TaxID=556532 RepID=A0A8J3QZ21_9ACTN|nr:MoxR family ATPase [Rugosimonospora africana]GIH18854.1 MoxR-like ATPase [Rugosimonospora africana]
MSQPQPPTITPEYFATRFTEIADNIERVIRGKRDIIELALTCLLAEGHLLIEDVPGVGKTMLARSLAASIDGRLQRIQFTPDLLPSDVTGVSIYNPANGAFQFHPGPVFANILHGDEINRASPKTQSALLEVMEERRVTVDGRPQPVPRPFMVIATQNPIDMSGTYPLPEAQLDRFLMRLSVGYPDHASEVSVLMGTATGSGSLVEGLSAVSAAAEIGQLIAFASNIYVAPSLYDYIVELVAATRVAAGVRLGASPRASVALLRAARARAVADSRGYVTPADVKALAVPVLSHRIVLTPEAELRGRTAAEVVEETMAGVPVPQTATVARS